MLIKGTVFFGVNTGTRGSDHSIQTIWIIKPMNRGTFSGKTTAFFWRYHINLYDVLR